MNEITATPCRVRLCDHGDQLHMIEDHAAGALTVIDERAEVSDLLYGGRANAHYTDDRSRLVVTRVSENVHGEFIAQVGTGRAVDYAGNERDLFEFREAKSSPVYDNDSDARQWAFEALSWALDNMTGNYGGSLTPFPLDTASHTYCRSCGHFDTLRVELQAWADVTTCSTPGCTFEDRRSIGD